MFARVPPLAGPPVAHLPAAPAESPYLSQLATSEHGGAAWVDSGSLDGAFLCTKSTDCLRRLVALDEMGRDDPQRCDSELNPECENLMRHPEEKLAGPAAEPGRHVIKLPLFVDGR